MIDARFFLPCNRNILHKFKDWTLPCPANSWVVERLDGGSWIAWTVGRGSLGRWFRVIWPGVSLVQKALRGQFQFLFSIDFFIECVSRDLAVEAIVVR